MKAIRKSLLKTSTVAALAILVIFFFSSFITKKVVEPCNNPSLLTEANKKLNNYTLVKDYSFYFKKGNKEEAEMLKQTVTLNRGVRYKFFAVEDKKYAGKPIVSIYNNSKMEFMIATTYNPQSKKFYDEIEFECKATGNYCIAFSFQNALEGCAVGVHAFLK